MIQSVLQFIPQEKSSQKQDILSYLFRRGAITRIEAFHDLGICELSSRIGELQKDGWRFDRNDRKGVSKNGRHWIVTEYSNPRRL
jgi:hypothetical protein